MLEKITQEELDALLSSQNYYDLSYHDLSGLSFVKARTNGSIEGCSFEHSDLSFADLSRLYINGACFYDANLEGTRFNMSNLDDVDFTRARNLDKAHLSWTSTEGIEGMRCIGVQVDTSRGNNRITYWQDLGIVTTGCFTGTMEQLKAQVLNTHKNNPLLLARYNRAIEYIEIEATYTDMFEEDLQ